MAMKTIILTIKDKVPGPPEAYPVALDVEGTVTSGSLLVAGLAEELRALLVDPGRFQARELGGDDPAGGGPSPNDEFARWLHDFAFGGDLKAAWNAVVKAGFRLVLDIAPADLRRLRWEQLGASPIYPARLPNCSVVRGKFCADATAEFRDGPIKLLVVVGSAKNDENVLAEEEVAVLQRMAVRAERHTFDRTTVAL